MRCLCLVVLLLFVCGGVCVLAVVAAVCDCWMCACLVLLLLVVCGVLCVVVVVCV